MRGETDAVENEHTRRAKGLGQHPVALESVHHQPADQEGGPGHEAERDAQRRRDQVVLKSVFDEQDDAEKHRHPAEPGEELHAQEFLQRKGLGRCFRDGRRWFGFFEIAVVYELAAL